MIIRIKSCQSPHYWYRDKIGKKYTVYPEHNNSLGYCVHLGRVTNSYVDYADAELIPTPVVDDFVIKLQENLTFNNDYHYLLKAIDMEIQVTDETRTLGTVRNRIKFAWLPVYLSDTQNWVWLEYYRQHQVWTQNAGKRVVKGDTRDEDQYAPGWLNTNYKVTKVPQLKGTRKLIRNREKVSKL